MPTSQPRTPQTPQALETRARILDVAIDACIELGYRGATMREIARRAGVSLGSAYYYFPSKAHLVQGFYARCHVEHRAACREVLAREQSLRSRLAGVFMAWLDTVDRHHAFAGVLFQTVADPGSPLNPFSPESASTRNDAIALFRDVATGADTRIPADVAPFLPLLLWLSFMGITLFWIHDTSPARSRTRRLMSGSAELVAVLVGLARVPAMAPARRVALRLLQAVVTPPDAKGVDDSQDPQEDRHD